MTIVLLRNVKGGTDRIALDANSWSTSGVFISRPCSPFFLLQRREKIVKKRFATKAGADYLRKCAPEQVPVTTLRPIMG